MRGVHEYLRRAHQSAPERVHFDRLAARETRPRRKANHAQEWDENAPDYTVLESDVFRVGDFAHEAVALAEPTRPLCAPHIPGGCAHRDELPERTWLSYDEHDTTETTLRGQSFSNSREGLIKCLDFGHLLNNLTDLSTRNSYANAQEEDVALASRPTPLT